MMLKKLYITSIFFTFLIGQGIGTDWIDVRGKTNDQIKKLISDEIKNLEIYPPETIGAEQEKLNGENEDAKYDFNSKKIKIRSELNNISAAKQSADINLINAKDAINDSYSRLKTQEQIVSDSDSSISNNQQVIDERKDLVEEELSKIPFHAVLVSVTYGHDGNNVKQYDNAMDYRIAKKAIDDQIGYTVIKASIVDNGILEDERIKTLLTGKANSTLTSTDIDELTNQGSLIFNRVRYGLVTVYPFQVDDNSILNSPPKGVGKKIETFISDSQGARTFINKFGGASLKRKIRAEEQNAESKNIESNSTIQRLGGEAKGFIDDRSKEIKRAISARKQALLSIGQIKEEIVDAISDSTSKGDELQKQTIAFNTINSQYTNHIFSERHVFVDTRYQQRVENVDMIEQYVSSAFSLFDIFIDNVNSQLVKEETEITDEQLNEFEGTKKEGIQINGVRLLGRSFVRNRTTEKTELGFSMAFNYGFTFKDIDVSDLPSAPFKVSKTAPKSTPKRKIAAKNKYNINITSNPNADVFLSGRKIGKTPLQYYLDPSSPHGIVLKKKGYRDKTDVVSVSAGRLVTKNYKLDKVKEEKVVKKSGGSKWLLYAIIGGGAAYAAMGQKKEGEKTGSLSITISIPN
jgi:hypothetical protein